jgi:hypothetical protein
VGAAFSADGSIGYVAASPPAPQHRGRVRRRADRGRRAGSCAAPIPQVAAIATTRAAAPIGAVAGSGKLVVPRSQRGARADPAHARSRWSATQRAGGAPGGRAVVLCRSTTT